MRSSDAEGFRRALRTFTTGVTVVTSASDDAPYGVTANAFTPVSFVPPLVLVCLSTASAAAATIARNGVFAVNVLSDEQEWMSRRFASRTRPRGVAAFVDVPHRTAATGSPILEDAACWLDCRLEDMHVAGDHVIAIGAVLGFYGDPSREPLVFHAGRYRTLRDRDAPSTDTLSLPTTSSQRR
jgi:3-hydroxy-9,10-secoandrosta-1,3,5(10)-triene-9,17-dione monooxygenase reductase component